MVFQQIHEFVVTEDLLSAVLPEQNVLGLVFEPFNHFHDSLIILLVGFYSIFRLRINDNLLIFKNHYFGHIYDKVLVLIFLN